MSVVTSLIVSFPMMHDREEGKCATEINEWIHENCSGQKGLVYFDDDSIAGWYGGGKCLQAKLYCGAFNYLDLAALIQFIGTLEWDTFHDEVIQLIVKEEEDERFRIIDIPAKVKRSD